jgi:hypothetical protein
MAALFANQPDAYSHSDEESEHMQIIDIPENSQIQKGIVF